MQRDSKRQPRILFLADRNNLAGQAFLDFSGFNDDALIRIKPSDIAKKGEVPKNGSVFFTIFQTFMSGPDGKPYFGEYEKDFFDFVIIFIFFAIFRFRHDLQTLSLVSDFVTIFRCCHHFRDFVIIF